jgi:hypothetical protein
LNDDKRSLEEYESQVLVYDEHKEKVVFKINLPYKYLNDQLTELEPELAINV